MSSPLPILTVTLNPSLDMSSDADQITPGDKIRCDDPALDPGGGGINVARAICNLGGTATGFVALAGFRGQQVAAQLRAQAVPHLVFDLPGETRLSLAVGDRAAHNQYRFVMPGPVWDTQITAACLAQINRQITAGMLVVLSGSMPPGVPDDLIHSLSERIKSRGGALIIDTSGAALTAAAHGRMGVALLRLDQSESEALAQKPLPSARDAAQFARGLINAGAAQMVVLGRGAEGSILVTKATTWIAQSPKVPVRSKVGAGDSFLGAFTYTMAQQKPAEEALRHGVAAASAAVMSEATSLCAGADVEALLPQITLTRLNL